MNKIRKEFLFMCFNNGTAVRKVQTNASLIETCTALNNRNPRNLELMTIGRKRTGYHLDKESKSYWHKLHVTETGRFVEVKAIHFERGPVVIVSTKEWGLKKQLYKTVNVAAFSNLGRVFAQRCLESGISEIYNDIDKPHSRKYTILLEEIKNNGLKLEESIEYKHANPWDCYRMVKPWTVQE